MPISMYWLMRVTGTGAAPLRNQRTVFLSCFDWSKVTRIACSIAGTRRALLILSEVTSSHAFAGSNALMSTWASPR